MQCKICQNPDAAAIVQRVKYDEIDYKEANRLLGFKPEDKALWRHVREDHERRRLMLTKYDEKGGISEQLGFVNQKLFDMFKYLDGKVVDEKVIDTTIKLSKELRGLAESVLNMEAKLQSKSEIKAQNITINFHNMNEWLSGNLCDHCREKLVGKDGPTIIDVEEITDE